MKKCLCIFVLLLLMPNLGLSLDPNASLLIPMQDGTRLATDTYWPESGGSFPVVLMRSTYGRKLGPVEGFVEHGYAVVVQDVRGRGGSEGHDDAFFADGWRPGLQDGADTVAWIKAQPWCNGKIATHGGSALGITQVLLSPATQDVTCQYIDSAACNFYGQVSYQGGVFRKSMCEGWLALQKIPHVIELWKAHPFYDDFWSDFNAGARAGTITAPALHVGSWQDIFATGTLEFFMARQTQGGPGARGNQRLIMKWGTHGPDICPDFKYKDNRFDVKVSRMVMNFFDAWCKGEENGLLKEPPVTYYVLGDDRETGAPGMQWRTATTWPPFPTEETRFYLRENGLLSRRKPHIKESESSFIYDPSHPFPTHGGANLILPAGPFDQSKVNQGRTDLLRFATEPLDEPLEITGRISAHLFVATDCPDTDFTAKLVDIYPPGDEREILMCDGIQRVKLRKGFAEPAPLLESHEQTVALDVDLGITCWIINKGHRIGLQISSSNYPRFERNPNTGEDFPSDKAMSVARNAVHMDRHYPSALLLPLRDSKRDDDQDGLSTRKEWRQGYDPDKVNMAH